MAPSSVGSDTDQFQHTGKCLAGWPYSSASGWETENPFGKHSFENLKRQPNAKMLYCNMATWGSVL